MAQRLDPATINQKNNTNQNKINWNDESVKQYQIIALCNVAYCIGRNTEGNGFKAITNDYHPNISNIHCGNGYDIYSDKSNDNIWVKGKNDDGECGVGRIRNVQHLKMLKYFKHKDISIKKICTNINRNTTFWITENRNVYGNGRNNAGQLGIEHTKNMTYSPVLISFLRNKYITDIQMVGDYSLALHDKCYETSLIMFYWSKMQIPNDIIRLILVFVPIVNNVYSTQYTYDTKWREINNFKDDSIIKIRSGRFHAFFLQQNGMLWCVGANHFGQLGINDTHTKKYVEDPMDFPLFMRQEIIIKEIKCGAFHNLLIDYNGIVYSWGKNDKAQCGQYIKNTCDDNTQETHVFTPQIIKSLQKYKVIDIGCGANHSYCGTFDGKYFLFGCNDHNECMTFDQRKKVKVPYCANHVIKQKCNAKKIISMALDYCNTKIIVSY